MADEQMDTITKYFAKYTQGYCYSKAILEDYSKLAAKIEGVEPKEVEERITKRMKEIVLEVREEIGEKSV